MVEEVKTKQELDLPPLSIDLGRQSYNGLLAFAGQVQEECNRDLVWPMCITTYKAMLKDATIASTTSLMEMQITKVPWKVKAPEGFEEELKDKVTFLRSVMEDMEHSWTEFVRQAASFNHYGFAPIEKVFRKRLRSEGSRFNDGLYGIRELPLISQDSVAGWDWDSDGKKLTALYQWRNVPTGLKDSFAVKEFGEARIRREKFMLFRANPLKDSPIGVSPLNSIYMAWRYKTEMERQESVGVATDVRGQKVIYLPPQFMSETATPEEKSAYEGFKRVLAGMHTGEQSGIILPRVYDDSGKPLFEYEIKSVLGTSTYNVSEIISRYRREIVTGLLAPMMILGQDGSGSFALASSLEGITRTVVEARLVEIKDVLNKELIPQLFEVNGWDLEVLPYFEFDFSGQETLEELSKYIQRVAAVGMLPKTPEMVNFVTRRLGIDDQVDGDLSVEELAPLLTGYTSGAGEGLEKGSGSGTSDNVDDRDSSLSNLEN